RLAGVFRTGVLSPAALWVDAMSGGLPPCTAQASGSAPRCSPRTKHTGLGLTPGASIVIGASTAKLIHPRRLTTTPSSQRGATLVEFVIAGPLVLFILLVLMQYALLFHARSQLNYATFEAARAGTVANARPAAM